MIRTPLLAAAALLALGLSSALAQTALAQTAPPVVTITLRLDDAALAELTRRGEKVVVAGWYYGDPAPGTTIPVDEMGMIYLGAEELTIWPAAQTTLTLGANLGSAPLEGVLQPMLNVNVFTARHTDENNLIDCGLVEGPIADLATAPQQMTCTLIGG